MKQFYHSAVTVLCALSLIIASGCASIVSSTSYKVPLNSSPEGANVTVSDFKGRVITNGHTPTVVRLRAGAGYFRRARYLVRFEMEGYDTKIVPVAFDINGWYFGNVLFGGLIGFLIIDPITGAMWKLDTKYVNETLKQTTASRSEPALQVLHYASIPASWKPYLVRLK